MSSSLDVLIIETPANARSIREALRRGGYASNFEQAGTIQAIRQAIKRQSWDVVVAGYTLPGFSALDALALIQNHALDLPFIVVSEPVGEEAVAAVMRAGASDYLNKDKLAGLATVVEREVQARRGIEKSRCGMVECERVERALEEAEQRYRTLFDDVGDAIFIHDLEGHILDVNRAACERLGYSREELLQMSVADIDTVEYIALFPIRIEELHQKEHCVFETAHIGRDGMIIPVELSSRITEYSDESVVLSVARDITERKLAEKRTQREWEIQQQIQEQDRLATVGQFAAGIAHDFNNIIAVIMLHVQLMLQKDTLSLKARERLKTIVQQANRASALIDQVLDFSRRTVVERTPLDLALFLKEQTKLLERMLPETIAIKLAFDAEEEYFINADLTRIQQSIMNIVLNARDAMPEGGELRLGLARVYIEDGVSEFLLPEELEAGEWIRLRIADTGQGIRPDVLPHIFEPFFTTKSPGKGTGLGLAQVYGIVKLHGGTINVSTRPNKGTTFNVYFPALPLGQIDEVSDGAQDLPHGSEETILVVEDEKAVRQALVDSLEMLNYHTLIARNGREALEILERQQNKIRLVLSDVVMPVMSGIAMAQTVHDRYPQIQIILLSGHALEDQLGDQIESLKTSEVFEWLPKPPRLQQLAVAVARALQKMVNA